MMTIGYAANPEMIIGKLDKDFKFIFYRTYYSIETTITGRAFDYTSSAVYGVFSYYNSGYPIFGFFSSS